MALESGARLGVYDILALLGAGGMGEVSRARDSKLGRDVALKLLPALFTTDPERLARFRREAQVLASLNRELADSTFVWFAVVHAETCTLPACAVPPPPSSHCPWRRWPRRRRCAPPTSTCAG